MYMYSVVRIYGDISDLNELVTQLSSIKDSFNARINRKGHLVAVLSKERDDWAKHFDELKKNLETIEITLAANFNSFEKVVLDFSSRSPNNDKDDGYTFFVYDFEPKFLAFLGNKNISLEITIS